LPLLCRAVLERSDDEEQRAFTFTEGDMCLHADRVAARQESARRGKWRRRPPPPTSELPGDTLSGRVTTR
jgi:hypothetical protein